MGPRSSARSSPPNLGAIIWNTDELGRPDMLRLAYRAYITSSAEAVICISNKTLTWEVVHGLEQRGIPHSAPSGTRNMISRIAV